MSRRAWRLLIGGVILIASVVSAAAQTSDGGANAAASEDADTERLVREGLAEVLEQRWHGGRTVDELHGLAQAHANKARRVADSSQRAAAWRASADKYAQWLEALTHAATGLSKSAALAAGRVEYANMLLAGPVAQELDQLELSAALRGDRDSARQWLEAARDQYEQAGRRLERCETAASEEDLLAAGVYDKLAQTRLDRAFNLAWTWYYLGTLAEPGAMRGTQLGSAERAFSQLLEDDRAAPMQTQCRLGLGLTLRAQERYQAAEATLLAALREKSAEPLRVRLRYELARCEVAAGKFDEARATLHPLVEQMSAGLADADQEAARFYYNLALLWQANSYLAESEALADQPISPASEDALRKKIQRQRATGLRKLRQLGDRGEPWPALVRLYVARYVDADKLTPDASALELLCAADQLQARGAWAAARDCLERAQKRVGNDDDLRGDIAFALGRSQYQLGELRAAAQTFGTLGAGQRNHARAAQAVGLAAQLWARVAQNSGRRDDYHALTDTLRNLLEHYGDHPRRELAAWLLPAALQQAGEYAEAAQHYALVPAGSAHWEEAQYRRVICLRQACTASAGADDDQAECLRRAADELAEYARSATARADQAEKPAQVREWAALAAISAAEVLALSPLDEYAGALTLLADFERRQVDGALLGRVLAVRIRAYRGLRQFDQATAVLTSFLAAADADQAGRTLSALAVDMQQEVDRLLAADRPAEARELARGALDTFDALERWLSADERRSAHAVALQAARARMYYVAQRYDEAEHIVTKLLEADPRNGNLQHLLAQIRTDQLASNATAAEIERAREAWAALLVDPAIRTRAPQRYWEARYHWLELDLRLGHAEEVIQAITQERIWNPRMGGGDWQPEFDELLSRAQQAAGD